MTQFSGKRFMVSILVALTAALTGCGDPLPGDGINPDGGMNSDAATDSGMTPDANVPDSGNGMATLVATLKAGVAFVTTGTSVEGVSCEAPFIVQATNVSRLAGPSCTVNGQTVTCTNVPREQALDVRSCIRDSAAQVRIINLSTQSTGCPLQRNEWESVKADGVELDNTVGIDTDSGPGLYCRIEL